MATDAPVMQVAAQPASARPRWMTLAIGAMAIIGPVVAICGPMFAEYMDDKTALEQLKAASVSQPLIDARQDEELRALEKQVASSDTGLTTSVQGIERRLDRMESRAQEQTRMILQEIRGLK